MTDNPALLVGTGCAHQDESGALALRSEGGYSVDDRSEVADAGKRNVHPGIDRESKHEQLIHDEVVVCPFLAVLVGASTVEASHDVRMEHFRELTNHGMDLLAVVVEAVCVEFGRRKSADNPHHIFSRFTAD